MTIDQDPRRFPRMTWAELFTHLHDFQHQKVHVSVRAIDGAVPTLDVFGRLGSGPLDELEGSEMIMLNITEPGGGPGLVGVLTLSEDHLEGAVRAHERAIHLHASGVQITIALVPDIPAVG